MLILHLQAPVFRPFSCCGHASPPNPSQKSVEVLRFWPSAYEYWMINGTNSSSGQSTEWDFFVWIQQTIGCGSQKLRSGALMHNASQCKGTSVDF